MRQVSRDREHGGVREPFQGSQHSGTERRQQAPLSRAGYRSRVSMPGSTPQHTGDLKLSEVIAALSCALDLVEGHPLGHAGRTCLLALRLAAELRLPSTERAVLFHATLLKDAGCLT